MSGLLVDVILVKRLRKFFIYNIKILLCVYIILGCVMNVLKRFLEINIMERDILIKEIISILERKVELYCSKIVYLESNNLQEVCPNLYSKSREGCMYYSDLLESFQREFG